MILVDWGVLPHSDLSHGPDMQKSTFSERLLGDVLREEELVSPEAIERALVIQSRRMTTSSL
ncbi:MAG: hypothetical protein V3T91_01325 [Candidatus Bipolaricaulota bacterium]